LEAGKPGRISWCSDIFESFRLGLICYRFSNPSDSNCELAPIPS